MQKNGIKILYEMNKYLEIVKTETRKINISEVVKRGSIYEPTIYAASLPQKTNKIDAQVSY